MEVPEYAVDWLSIGCRLGRVMGILRGGHPDEVPLSREERLAIAALRRLASRWPRSLWLFSASGDLCVMRRGEQGDRVLVAQDEPGASMDQTYVVTSIDVPNDGGDW